MTNPITEQEDNLKVVSPLAPTFVSDMNYQAESSNTQSTSTINPSAPAAKTTAPAPNPANPALPSPKIGVTASDVVAYSLDREQEIAKNILDSWLESIREEAARIAEQLRSAAYQSWLLVNNPEYFAQQQIKSAALTEISMSKTPQYQEWIASLNPDMRAQEWYYQQTIALRIGMAESVDNFSKNVERGDPESVAMLPFMAATLVIGEDLINLSALSMSALPTVGVSATTSFQEIWHTVAPAILGTIDVQAQLGFIGSLFATGIIYQTTVEGLVSKKNKYEKEKNRDFANQYSKNMIQLTTGVAFGDFVKVMLMSKINKGELTEARKEELVAFMKIILLSTALAFLYKVQTGKITGQEFGDMINGKMTLEPDSMESKLVQLIRYFSGSISTSENAKIHEALIAYMDNDPKINNLLDPGHAFEGLLQNFQSSVTLAG
jgi:hypothetical protein